MTVTDDGAQPSAISILGIPGNSIFSESFTLTASQTEALCPNYPAVLYTWNFGSVQSAQSVFSVTTTTPSSLYTIDVTARFSGFSIASSVTNFSVSAIALPTITGFSINTTNIGYCSDPTLSISLTGGPVTAATIIINPVPSANTTSLSNYLNAIAVTSLGATGANYTARIPQSVFQSGYLGMLFGIV